MTLQQHQPTDLAELTELEAVGQMANGLAAQSVVADYLDRRAYHTRRRQAADLARFAKYLNSLGQDRGLGEGLAVFGKAVKAYPEATPDMEAWRGVTWGLVEGFKRWQLAEGYAIGSIGVGLATLKRYARLAHTAGVLDTEALALIRNVSGYSQKEARQVDERRETQGTPTRIDRAGAKKAEPVHICQRLALQLKTHDDTPQGRRDTLLMCLLLDHGLRVGEVAGLQVEHFKLKDGEMAFYRPKVDKKQRHRLTDDTLRAAIAYFEHDAPESGPLLKGSQKGGALRGHMSTRAITKRVKALGESVGLEGLSAHDCRHFWATQAARNGTPLDKLMTAGGWSSYAMPLRYIEDAKIANEGVVLGGEGE